MSWCGGPTAACRPAWTHGQRISNTLKGKDLGEEVGAEHAGHHLSAEAVLVRMTLQERHGEASQPAQVVAQGPLAGAALVLAEVHVQHPVHRLDPPVAAHRFAEPLAAKVAAAEVIPHLV